MDIWGQITLCPAGYLMHFRVFSSIPDIYSLDPSSIHIAQTVTIKTDSRNCQISPFGKKITPSCELLIYINFHLSSYIFLDLFSFCPTSFRVLSWTSVRRACYTRSVMYQDDRELTLRRSRFSFLYLILAVWPGTIYTSSLSLSFFNHKMERLD